jgi:hypothetical protein
MTARSTRIPVLNSLLFIRDARIRDLPAIDGNSPLWSTSSCVAVSCLPDCDGATEVTIGAVQELSERGAPLFDGRLNTPSQNVIVETVLGERILETKVPSLTTRLRIWTNGRRDTDKVIIGLG